MSDERIEQLLEEGNELRRQALAAQQEAIGLQKEALAEQRRLIADTRANLDLARGVNERAAELQLRARRMLALLLPVIVVLIAYVSWLLFFKVPT
jgi:NAD-specific glutamate dehydrogenase